MFNLKTLWKDNLRGITGSFSRFISITLIVMLGVAIFAGISAAGPDMLNTARYDYEKGNLADHTIISTVGFNDEDVEVMESIEGAEAETLYFQDIILDGTSTAARFFGYQPEQNINTYTVIEGRMPEAANEIAIDNSEAMNSEYSIGDTISINEYEDSTLTETEFEIVGIVSAPQYIDNVQRGVTSIGSGTLDGFVVVQEDIFDMENPTMANVTYEATENLQAYTDEYETVIEEKTNEMETALEGQAESREADLREDINTEISDGETQIQEAEDELANAESQLSATRQQLEAAGLLDVPVEVLPAQAAAQVEAFNEAEATFEEERQTAETEMADAEAELADAREMADDLTVEFFVQDRSDFPGYMEYSSNADRITAIARVFPVFFLLVALLVTLTTMTRMVEEDRNHIGTLKSLGYSNFHVSLKYVTYSGIAGLVGTVSGLSLGYWLLPTIIINAYSSLYEFSTIHIQWYPWITVIAVIAAFLATVGATLSALGPTLNAMPADLLTDPAPKEGKKILLERWTWLWDKISFNYKVAFRNIFRYKKRMWMTIIGVAGCTALMLLGFGVSDSVNDVLNGQYSDYTRYDGMVVLDSKSDSFDEETYQNAIDNSNVIESSKGVYTESYTTETESEGNQDISITVPESLDNMEEFSGLYDAETDEVITELPDEGVMVTQKIAEMKNLEVGDEIVVEDADNQSYTFEVARIYKNYVGHELLMTAEEFESVIGEEPTLNTTWLTFERTEENEETIRENFSEQEYVQSVVMVSTIEEAFGSSLASLDLIVLVLIIAAALLAIIVLYNLTNVNVGERKKELATLKVLGFHDLELTMYIYRENIFLTLFGILFGYVLGIVLHRYIMLTVEFNNMMFGRTIHLTSFVYATALTILFSIIVLVIIHFRLKRTNLMDSLNEE